MFGACPNISDGHQTNGAGAAGTTFAFGKHRGRTFEETADADPSYCEWALRLDGPSGQLQAFVEFVKARGTQMRPAASSMAGVGTPSGASSTAGMPHVGGSAFGGSCPGPPRLASIPGPPWQASPMPPGNNFMAGGAPYFPGVPQYGAVAAQGPRLRLQDDETFVCELLPDRQFLVRAERAPGLPQNAWGNGGMRGGLIYLPPDIWKAIGTLPGAKLAGNRRAWTFQLDSHEIVARGLQQMGAVEMIPPWVLQMMDASARQPDPGELDCTRLPDRLLPYQLEGVRFGISRGGRCLIGDEMGLGKTVQALALAAQYAQEWPVLVVCPSSLRWVWKEQAEDWLPRYVREHEVQVIKKGSDTLNLRAKFWIISYSLLAADMKNGKFQQRPDGSPHAIVIADESHNVKDWGTARTKALIPLLRRARRAILLSGTPTRNSADELHPQLVGLLPWLPVRIEEFRTRYCVQRPQQIFGGKSVNKVVGARNAAELNHLLTNTVMVRRLKKDVLTQLPPKRRQKIPMDVSDSKLMREVRAEMQRMKLRTGVGVSPELLRTGDGRLHDFGTVTGALDEVGGGGAVSTLFQKMAQAKLPAVKEYILEVLERGEEKAIIFAHHLVVLDEISSLLEASLPKYGLTHVRIDGRTAVHKRTDLVKSFQENPSCRIALLSITACGEGLTLTAAGLVIFAELYWVPGAIEQAEARAHRIGTSHNRIIVEFLVVPNSPDEQIYNSLERKKKDTSHVLNGAAESLDAAHRARKRDCESDPEPMPIDAGKPTDGMAGVIEKCTTAAKTKMEAFFEKRKAEDECQHPETKKRREEEEEEEEEGDEPKTEARELCWEEANGEGGCSEAGHVQGDAPEEGDRAQAIVSPTLHTALPEQAASAAAPEPAKPCPQAELAPQPCTLTPRKSEQDRAVPRAAASKATPAKQRKAPKSKEAPSGAAPDPATQLQDEDDLVPLAALLPKATTVPAVTIVVDDATAAAATDVAVAATAPAADVPEAATATASGAASTDNDGLTESSSSHSKTHSSHPKGKRNANCLEVTEEEPWRCHLKRALDSNTNRGSGSSKGFQQAVLEASWAAPRDLVAEIVGVLQVFQANTCGPAKARIFSILYPDKALPKYYTRSSKITVKGDASAAKEADNQPTDSHEVVDKADVVSADQTTSGPSASKGGTRNVEAQPTAQTLGKWFKTSGK